MVDFLIIGTPKSGTTALQEYLNAHPEIFMPKNKELHYFGSEFKTKHTQYSKELTEVEYSSIFQKASKTQTKGEASVFYLYSKDAYEQIKAYNPDMKIIVCFRHPVDFLISYHQDALYVEIEDEKIFHRALELENERKKGNSIPKTTSFIKSLFYSELIDYKTHLENFIHAFSRKNVHIIIFEELISNPEKEYKNVLEFLNLATSDFTLNQFKKINPRRNIKSKIVRNFIKKPNSFLRFLLRIIFPFQKLRYYIYKIIQSLNTDHKKINDLSFQEKRELQKKYLNNITSLEKFIKKDLSIWKNKYV